MSKKSQEKAQRRAKRKKQKVTVVSFTFSEPTAAQQKEFFKQEGFEIPEVFTIEPDYTCTEFQTENQLPCTTPECDHDYYFKGQDFSLITLEQYEKVWELLTDNYTRYINTQGFSRYSFGAAGTEDDWIPGVSYNSNDFTLNCGTNAENSVIFAFYREPGYAEEIITELPYAVIPDKYDRIEMKFVTDGELEAPFSSSYPKLIKWLEPINNPLVIPMNLPELGVEILKDELTTCGWKQWAGFYYKDDSKIRLLPKSLELSGTIKEKSNLDRIELDNLPELLEWIN